MAAFIVSYDLKKQGQNYDCIIEKLNAYPTHWHMQQSVWIIATARTCKQIRDDLLPCLDQNDKLFVGQLSAAAWHGYNDKTGKWLVECIK